MQQKMKWLLLLLLLITICAVGIAVWALFFRAPDLPLPPDYAPIETEEYAQKIVGDSEEKNQTEQGGGNVSLTYSNEVLIDISEEKVMLKFANPTRSTHDIILQIVVQNEILAQSGLLVTGNEVALLDLLDGVAEKLQIGGYDGNFLLYYYDQKTGERAVVNTEIPISITVRE